MTYIKKCKAKRLDSNQYCVGSYFQMPKVNICPMSNMFDEEYEKNIGHYIVFCHQNDWNMNNEIKAVEIDPKTLRILEEEWTIG